MMNHGTDNQQNRKRRENESDPSKRPNKTALLKGHKLFGVLLGAELLKGWQKLKSDGWKEIQIIVWLLELALNASFEVLFAHWLLHITHQKILLMSFWGQCKNTFFLHPQTLFGFNSSSSYFNFSFVMASKCSIFTSTSWYIHL